MVAEIVSSTLGSHHMADLFVFSACVSGLSGKNILPAAGCAFMNKNKEKDNNNEEENEDSEED